MPSLLNFTSNFLLGREFATLPPRARRPQRTALFQLQDGFDLKSIPLDFLPASMRWARACEC
jgi:hypothetical protein